MDNKGIYKGYKEISGNTDYINQYMNDIAEDGYNDWYTNEYLLIHNTDTGERSEMRFDGEQFVALKLPPSRYVKGKNGLQRCALDMLNNKDITICALLGLPGSGKTYMALNSALHAVRDKGYQSKILCVREVSGEGRSPGFLPGTLDKKIELFIRPFVQCLQGGEFEAEHLYQTGTIETAIYYYLKGTTFDSCIIVCDEAEDITKKQIKLVGTRVGKESRIFFCGDQKQSLIDTSDTNPFVQMCHELKGNPNFACVVLNDDVRSDTSKIFANLFC